jgi:hypothetical protein
MSRVFQNIDPPSHSPPGECVLTVKRVDKVVWHQHLVTQDQFTQVSSKIVSDIPAEDFTINIQLFLQTFTNVEFVRQNWISQKWHYLGANLDYQIYFPMLYHCATPSSLFKSTLKDIKDAAELHLYSLLFTLYSLFVLYSICICICILFSIVLVIQKTQRSYIFSLYSLLFICICIIFFYCFGDTKDAAELHLYSLLFICICICICIYINLDFIVTVELFRQWKYRIKAFIVTVKKVRQGQWTP